MITVSDKAVLKKYFETGDFPTQAQFYELINSVHPYWTHVIDSPTDGPITLESNVHYVSRPGVVLTCDDTTNLSGLVGNGVENIILEGLTIDLATTAYDGVTQPPKNDWPNFTTGIDLRNCQRIWIKRCRFINSGSAHADWTMQACNMQNVNGLFMAFNHSVGCQYKLCGANGSLENVFFGNNYGRNNTQMGMSFVVQPQEGSNLRLANIQIVNNTFENTDQHSIYGGIDNGVGAYPGSVTIENINISGNLSNGTAYLNTTQTSKGILMNLTRDTRHVAITKNQIIGQAASTQVQGIQVNTSPTDVANGFRAKNITINENQISECENFNIVADDIDFFEIRGNKCERGKGIIVRRSNDGDVFKNKFRDTGGASVRIEDNCTNMRTDKKLADDTAAAAHGIEVGEFYYKTATGIVARVA